MRTLLPMTVSLLKKDPIKRRRERNNKLTSQERNTLISVMNVFHYISVCPPALFFLIPQIITQKYLLPKSSAIKLLIFSFPLNSLHDARSISFDSTRLCASHLLLCLVARQKKSSYAYIEMLVRFHSRCKSHLIWF